jgi:DNA-binding NarL/FixJ family response regulator
MSITVSIVEDDAGMRDGFANVINRDPDLRCIARYDCVKAALKGIPVDPPDVVLMDIHLPDQTGIECVHKLKPQLPGVDFIMLTMFGDRDLILDALRAGAVGYLLKSDRAVALVEAIKQTKAGGSPMSSEIARQVTRFFQSEPPAKTRHSELETLSDREREVLNLLATGQHYKEIAEQLHISVDTVRFHIRKIYTKLEVHSRAEIAAKFFMK